MESDKQPAERVDSIQVLRAAAAFVVLLRHDFLRMSLSLRDSTWHMPASMSFLQNMGSAGVDVFFVISGFIMLYAHYDYFRRPGAVPDFLAKRFIRILPIYWLLTALACVLLAVAPSLFSQHDALTWSVIWHSFLFVPITLSPHIPSEPIVGPGWSLTYEMMFYLALAAVLRFERTRAVAILTAVFCAAVAIGSVLHPPLAWEMAATNWLLIEFLLGVFIALGLRQGWLPRHRLLRVAVLAAGTVLIFVGGATKSDFQRFVYWGLPSALIVYGCTGLTVPRSWIGKVLTTLGDASYSLYLFQIFALPAVARVVRLVLPYKSMSDWLLAAILAVSTVLASVGFWYVVERPITAFLRRWYNRRQARSAPVPAPAVAAPAKD